MSQSSSQVAVCTRKSLLESMSKLRATMLPCYTVAPWYRSSVRCFLNAESGRYGQGVTRTYDASSFLKFLTNIDMAKCQSGTSKR